MIFRILLEASGIYVMVRSTLLQDSAPLGAQMEQWQLHPKWPLKWPLFRTPAPWWCPRTLNLAIGKLEEIPRKVFIPILVSGTEFLIDNGLGRGHDVEKWSFSKSSLDDFKHVRTSLETSQMSSRRFWIIFMNFENFRFFDIFFMIFVDYWYWKATECQV